MVPADPRDRDPKRGPPRQQPPRKDPPADAPRPDELHRKAVHQPKDKAAKRLYSDRGMVEEFLRKHVFGKIVPDEATLGVDLRRLWKAPTEHIDPKSRTVRHTDLVWKVPLRESWLHVVFLFEVQSTVDRRMPVRMLLEAALAYDQICNEPEVRKAGKLPPVLPIVVHVGTDPWTAPTRLQDMLATEAEAFLPFALGQQFLLVSEATEARSLAAADTPRTAGLQLRYAQSRNEFREALATLKSLLPPDSPARRPLLDWVRSSMINEGAKEETMARLNELEDLKNPVYETWWAKERREARTKGLEEGLEEGRAKGLEEGRTKGRAEGQSAGRREGRRATLLRVTHRKFGPKTADQLAALLDDRADAERFAEIADLLIDCATGRDFLAQAARSR